MSECSSSSSITITTFEVKYRTSEERRRDWDRVKVSRATTSDLLAMVRVCNLAYRGGDVTTGWTGEEHLLIVWFSLELSNSRTLELSSV
jgi:hypothetical protein